MGEVYERHFGVTLCVKLVNFVTLLISLKMHAKE